MLREVLEADLPAFFEHQRDPVASALAVSSAREWDEFVAHWRNKVFANPTAAAKTIVVGEQVAGYVASWERDGERLLCYWIGRAFWGRGIGPSAVAEFLRAHDHARPIAAYVARSNTRSARVLEKCGFRRADGSGADGGELLFLLPAA